MTNAGGITPGRSPVVTAPTGVVVPGVSGNVPAQPQQSHGVQSPAPYYQPLQARAASYGTPSAHPNTYQPTPVHHASVAAASPVPQPSPQPYSQPPPTYTPNRYAAPTPAPAPPPTPVYNPNAPRPIEVFHLSDTANAAIPAEVRSQFHCDDRGHVLFFSTPPLDMVSSPFAKRPLGHSLKYLAAKAEKEKARKRRREEEQHQKQQQITTHIDEPSVPSKRARIQTQDSDISRLNRLVSKTVSILAEKITAGTSEFYKSVYGENSGELEAADQKQRQQEIKSYTLAKRLAEDLKAQTTNDLASKVSDLRKSGVYLDDVN